MQQCLERRAPSRRKRLNPQSALEPFTGMIGRIQESIDLGYRHPLCGFSHFYNFVASADLPLLKHAKVKARLSARGEQCCHARLVHANADAIASHAGLRNFEDRTANLIPIADTDRFVRQAIDREVLTELSVDVIGPL
jgi:hypothetical protein